MKKILFSLTALVASMSMNAQVMKVMKNGEVEATYKGSEYSIVFEEEQGSTTTGTAKATIGGSEVDVNWVQLWENGPKFAEYNVGVTDGKAKSYGGYYCWGGSIDQDSHRAYKSGSDALTGDDDTATKLWGSAWRMPTQAELKALLTNCDVEWTAVNGVNGRKFTGKGDYASNFVFLPAAGYYDLGRLYAQGQGGSCWSSTPNGSGVACYLGFGSGSQSVSNVGRYFGCSVRAVLAEASSTVSVTSITLDKTTAEVNVGADVTLGATVAPEDATNKEVEWTSDNPDVATVDQTGKVTGVTAGTATITATAKDGSGVTATCTVTVKAAAGPETAGTAKATIGGSEVDVNWVQLWTDGPKFAEYNVGVTDGKAESYGGYYCWGSSIDKDRSYAYKEGTDALTGTDDTATNLWGSEWRMPTEAELQALLANCDVVWTTVNGVKGRKFTGKGDYASNSVFLPAAGSCSYGDVSGQGSSVDYWSSTPNGSDYAYYLLFNSGYQDVYYFYREYGRSVRAVLAEE